jgi:restriction system protein
MAVPVYQDFMYPFLKQLEDKKDYRLQDLLFLIIENRQIV